MSLSDDLRDELAAIAPRRRCCRLAELSALFHSAGTWHLRGHGELAVHLDLASPAAARRAFTPAARPRRPLGDPHLPPARVRPGDALPAPRRRRRRAAAEVLREAGVLSARGAPLERPPKRVVGRSCCRGAYLRGALLGGGSLSGPRDAAPRAARDAASTARASSPRSPRARASRSRRSSAARTRSRTRRAARRSPTCSRSRARARRRSASTSTRVVAATRAEANRLANADEANVKRTVDAAQAAARRRSSSSTSTACPTKLQEIATLRLKHPSLSLAELAAEVPAADHEGGSPSPDGRAEALAELPDSPGIDALRRACEPRAKQAGREGKLRGRPPPPTEPRSDRWRRTGSESGAGRAWSPPARVSRNRPRSIPGDLQAVRPSSARSVR